MTQNAVVLNDQKDKKMKTWKLRNAEFATNVTYRLTVSCDTIPMLSFCFNPFNQKAILMQVCDISVNILM